MRFIHIPHFEYLGIVNTRHIKRVKLTRGGRTSKLAPWVESKWSWRKFRFTHKIRRGWWFRPYITILFADEQERIAFNTNKEAETALTTIMKEITKK